MASLAPTPTSTYRGRIAPSPTGYLHVGHARTFWTAWQRARDAGGALIFRMEDLDAERSKAIYAEAAYEDLRWLGIRWLEGPDKGIPDKGGPFAPYLQSRRRPIYLAAWRKLLRRGAIYPCTCSRKDLEAALGAPHEREPVPGHGGGGKLDMEDDEPLYPGTCRRSAIPAFQLPGPTAEPEMPGNSNWRFRVPDGEAIEFVDRNLGPQRFIAGRDFGDFVVWRREANSPRTGSRPSGEGAPSYQLACVVDDHAMGITEVVRGADLLKSTARQILLDRALGYVAPAWFHCKLVVDHNGRRLAKRHDSLSVRALRQRGLTPMNILSAELPVEA